MIGWFIDWLAIDWLMDDWWVEGWLAIAGCLTDDRMAIERDLVLGDWLMDR